MELMPKNKKAIFFMLLALSMVAVSEILVATSFVSQREQTQMVLNTKLHTMNHFITSIEQDASKALYTAGFRSIVAILDDIMQSGTYRSNLKNSMRELILNNTLDNASIFIMENNTIIDWQVKMIDKAEELDITLAIDIGTISIEHTSPWTITFSYPITILMEDNQDVAWWNFTQEIYADVSIADFQDPLYIVGSGNAYSNLINTSPYSGQFVVGNSTNNLEMHMIGGHYARTSSAPSYLKRLEGDLSPDEFGIESLVDKDALSLILPIEVDKSNIDYIYFSSADPNTYSISGMPATFRMDNESYGNQTHLSFYNISDLTT